MSNALWRSTFLPPAKQAEALASRALVDLSHREKHRYWDVEVLDNAIRSRGVEAVLKELSEDAASGTPSTIKLYESLKEEAERLGKWNATTEPQRFLSLWRDRCFEEGWSDSRRQAEGVLFDCRWPSIQRCCDLADKPSDGAIDPNKVGLIASIDGRFLINVDRQVVSVWEPQKGEKLADWSAPAEITSAAALYDDVIALGLADGQLYLWELAEGAQYPYAKVEKSVKKIVSRGEVLVLWGYDGIHILDEEGKIQHFFALDIDEQPQLCISSDGKRLICGDGMFLQVWDIQTGQQLVDISDEDADTSDEEMMVAAVLDMGAHEHGLLAMDALEIWGLSLAAQFDLLQSMSEPLVVSPDGRYMVSAEDDGIAWWRLGKGGYSQVNKVKVKDMWDITSLRRLSDDCRYVATVVRDGIIAWDLQAKKSAGLPLPFAFTTTIHAIPKSRLLAVDNGQEVQIFKFVAD